MTKRVNDARSPAERLLPGDASSASGDVSLDVARCYFLRWRAPATTAVKRGLLSPSSHRGGSRGAALGALGGDGREERDDGTEEPHGFA